MPELDRFVIFDTMAARPSKGLGTSMRPKYIKKTARTVHRIVSAHNRSSTPCRSWTGLLFSHNGGPPEKGLEADSTYSSALAGASSVHTIVVARHAGDGQAEDSISLQVAHGTCCSTFVRKTRVAYSIQELFRLYYSMLSRIASLLSSFSSFRETHLVV